MSRYLVCNYKDSYAKATIRYLCDAPPKKYIEEIMDSVSAFASSIEQVGIVYSDIFEKATQVSGAIANKFNQVFKDIESAEFRLANTPRTTTIYVETYNYKGEKVREPRTIHINIDLIDSLKEEIKRLEAEKSRLEDLDKWVNKIKEEARSRELEFEDMENAAGTANSKLLDITSSLGTDLERIKPSVQRAMSIMEQFNSIHIRMDKTARGYIKIIGDK